MPGVGNPADSPQGPSLHTRFECPRQCLGCLLVGQSVSERTRTIAPKLMLQCSGLADPGLGLQACDLPGIPGTVTRHHSFPFYSDVFHDFGSQRIPHSSAIRSFPDSLLLIPNP